MNNKNYRLLIDKLDEFIRKYYKNQLIRGLIYSIGLVLLFYISVAVLEYYAHFSTIIRTILFYTFLVGNLFILGRLVFIPIFKLNKLGTCISHEQAADIIGKHFHEVNDKLLNTLQLLQMESSIKTTSLQPLDEGLIQASISQKINDLKPIPFSSAIDLSQNKKYIKYALFPVLTIAIMLLSSPSLITMGTKRLVQHDTYFEKESPFQFVINNKSLKAVQQQDFLLDVKLTGDEMPENVFIDIDENQFKLSKDNTVSFNYLFKNVQKTLKFRLTAEGYKSKFYELTALPNPILLDFNIELDYPYYTLKKDEILKNTGDLSVPAGTKIRWTFNTQNTKTLKMNFNDTAFVVPPYGENAYSYSARPLKNKTYSVSTSNDFLKNKDSVVYAINVIQDVYPGIIVEEKKDSLSSKRIFFRGNVKDDYGFSGLAFNYTFIHKEDSSSHAPDENVLKIKNIPINKTSTQDQFFHFWDVSDLALVPGDQIEYYFEVWDNDAVSGPKSARSQKMLFKAPSLKEIAENTEKSNDKIKDDLRESIKKAMDLQKELNDFDKKLLEKKTIGWEEKKKIQDLLDKQKELQKKVEQIKNESQKNNAEQSEYKKVDESILEKQKQLQNLFENVMSDEMKEKFKELEKLLDKLNKEQVKEVLEKMKLDNKDVAKELDRTLEIFKQLEFDQKLTETIEKLDDLSKKEDKQGDKSLEKNPDNKALTEKQEELNKEFEDVKKDMLDLQKKNEELSQPMDIKKTESEQQEIQQEMDKSKEQLKDNKNKKASASQKNAAQKMQEMSQKLSKMQSDMETKENAEDLKTLRDILENLVQLSFDQEALMGELSKTAGTSPEYVKITQKQQNLQNDSKMIEDSLLALSKRSPQIESIVNREISAIHLNMGKSIEALAERQTPEVAQRQQFAMTSINNLALLLSEVLDQMQQQMQSQNQKAGQGSCNKPGGKGQKPSMESMRKMQEQINKQIQSLKESMDKGGKKDGKKGGGSSAMSEELAKMAAQQEALRKQLQNAAEQLNKDGKGGGSLGKMAEKMEQTETDLVNKMISQETINRQQEILTKLLEHEKAEKERGMEEKRESKEIKNDNYGNPNDFMEYKSLKLKEVELLKTVPASLIPFYKNKVNEYFNHFEK